MDAAKSIGVNQSQFSRWCTGHERPNAHRLRQLAGQLDGFWYTQAVGLVAMALGPEVKRKYGLIGMSSWSP